MNDNYGGWHASMNAVVLSPYASARRDMLRPDREIR